ncbi:HNH endonuclease [Streptomyces phage TomSawyer]|nr:HNH endonuclease [Streptomyces phage TomSawyer]
MTARVKAWRDSKRKPCPGGCGAEVAYDTILCRKCTGQKRRDASGRQTIGEIKSTKKSRYSHYIRALIPKGLFKACAVCGYTNHVEVAHIKAIASFPDSATAAEVNATTNLIGLCPNHHWEYDNGVLSIS